MATAAQPEILDLRHFSAATLRPLLAEESRVWSERLRWDYRSSANLLLDYLDSHVLPGYVAVEREKLCGYIFCVYEGVKAVIGDVYCAPTLCEDAHHVEARLIEHLIELLQFSPGIDRIETQLLLHPHGAHAHVFSSAGFDVYPRLFMELDFASNGEAFNRGLATTVPPELILRSWRDTDFPAAGRLITAAYQGHLDSRINDQYQTVTGSLRFLHNIVRFPGCGIFNAEASRVLAYRDRMNWPACCSAHVWVKARATLHRSAWHQPTGAGAWVQSCWKAASRHLPRWVGPHSPSRSPKKTIQLWIFTAVRAFAHGTPLTQWSGDDLSANASSHVL